MAKPRTKAGYEPAHFLIPPTLDTDRGGQLRDIEPDFAAIIAPGLRLAFIDQVKVELQSTTIRGEEARRRISVCGAGAFVVMKALAFRSRGENKDAYDIAYLLRNYGGGPGDVAVRLSPHVGRPEVKEALHLLSEDFESINSLGPRRVSEFLYDARHDETEADAWGAVRDLLDALAT